MKRKSFLFSLLMAFISVAVLSVGVALAKYASSQEGKPFGLTIKEHGTYTYAVFDEATGALSIRNRKAVVVNDEDGKPKQLTDRDGTYDIQSIYALPYQRHPTDVYGQLDVRIARDEPPDGAIKNAWSTVHNDLGELEKIVVSVTFDDAVPLQGNLHELFQQWPVLQSIDMMNADFTDVTSVYKLFDYCPLLEEILLSPQINTANVTSMEYMFFGLSSLPGIDLSGIDTDRVTSMEYMFANCSALTHITLGDMVAPELTTMSRIFSGCTNLKTVSFGNITAKKLTSMASMFDQLNNLEAVTFDETVYTPSLTSMSRMFAICKKLKTVDFGKNFDTSAVTDMSAMFNDCNALMGLDLTVFDTSSVINMSNMFYFCHGLTELDVSNWNTSEVKYMSNLFYLCRGLTSLNVSSFDTSKVENMSGMFYGCSGLTTLDVSGFDTGNVLNMSSMFNDCTGLTELDVRSFDTSKVTTMASMFRNCYKISVYDLSSFDTANVTSMSQMFFDNKALTRIYASDSFVTEQVSSSGDMFGMPYTGTKPFYGGAGTQWVDANPKDKSYARIDGGPDAPGYFTEHTVATWHESADGMTHSGACSCHTPSVTVTEKHSYLDGVCKCGKNEE